jgi:hypothetical protein
MAQINSKGKIQKPKAFVAAFIKAPCVLEQRTGLNLPFEF